MSAPELAAACQVPCLRGIVEGEAEAPPQSMLRRLKLMVRRRMSPQTERRFKARTNAAMNWICSVTGKPRHPAELTVAPAVHLQAGDWVRVRSKAEIDRTLNHWRQLRGCTFMPEMVQYCESTQRVYKPLGRFVDERDLRVKTARGIVLLDRVICQGTAEFGRCDRSCMLFWREEWLERVDAPEREPIGEV